MIFQNKIFSLIFFIFKKPFFISVFDLISLGSATGQPVAPNGGGGGRLCASCTLRLPYPSQPHLPRPFLQPQILQSALLLHFVASIYYDLRGWLRNRWRWRRRRKEVGVILQEEGRHASWIHRNRLQRYILRLPPFSFLGTCFGVE